MGIKIEQQQKVKPIKKKRQKEKTNLFDFLNKDIQLFEVKLNDTKKEQIYTSLYALLNSGIPIAQALETLKAELEKKKDQVILDELLQKVISGSSLSNAFKNSGHFTTYEYYSIKIGEESGRLNEILKELYLFYAQKVEQKRKLIGALSYPIVVLSVAAIVVVFMLEVIVPMFADIFKRFGGNLPWITKQVLFLSEFVKHNIWYLLIFIGSSITILFWQRNNMKFIQFRQKTLLKIPIINELILKIYLSRFCKSMALLTAARIPITSALDMLSQMISFYPLTQGAIEVKQLVLKGKPIHEGFASAKIFPNKIIALVKIGEEVNKLEDMFNQLAEQYRQETEYRLQIFNSLLEPFLIIFLALIIGIILVAMYLPIFQLSTQLV